MANEENLNVIRSESVAREMQKKSAAKRSQNARERKLIREALAERMGVDDFNQIIDNMIERAKETNKGFELWRDTLGEKPVEQVNIMNVDKSQERLEELLKDDNV